MVVMRSVSILPLLAACTSSPSSSDDVVGPFTGPVHRYVVDRFELPLNNTDARAIGDDLNGDRAIDNQLGMVFGSLNGQNDLTTHAADMIAAGVLQTAVEIQADDLANDPTVGVRYLGAPGTPFTIMGGTLENGTFVSNRSATTAVPGAATLALPVFADADPSQIDAYAMELSFVPEADGSLDARVAGAVDPMLARKAVVDGIATMVRSNPQDHALLVQLFDANKDGQLSAAEIANNSLVMSLLAPDLDLRNGDGVWDSLSFGYGLHLVPCDSGTCAGPIADPCHDRVLDGDETDLDCGGSCGGCPAAAVCGKASDCQSQTCNPDGTCAAPTCHDGVRDGFEKGVDCGYGCGACHGEVCNGAAECASGQCLNNVCQ